MIDAILPAGGRIGGEFASETGVEVKALLPVGGKTILERTLETLRGTSLLNRAVVIAPQTLAEHPAVESADAVLQEGASGVENTFHGLEWLRGANGGSYPHRVLLVGTDQPFLTPESITSFIDSCPTDADICLPILRREAFEGRFPGLRAEYVRLRDGEWTMGGVFLVNPAALEANRATIERVVAARKSQLGMVRLLGLAFIARFLTRRLDVAHIEQRCVAILRCCGKAVPEVAPELAFDVDTLEEYRYAVRYWAEATDVQNPSVAPGA